MIMTELKTVKPKEDFVGVSLWKTLKEPTERTLQNNLTNLLTMFKIIEGR